MNYIVKAPKHRLLGGGLTLFLLFVLVGHASAGTYIWREAEDWTSAFSTGRTDWCGAGGWSQNSHLVFGNGHTEYQINFPESGIYHLWLRYAQADFPPWILRPTDIYLDGGLVLDDGTNSATGGWCGVNAIWEFQTTINIPSAGNHALKLDADDFLGCCWTHIDTIFLTTDGAFTPPVMWTSGGGFSNADDPRDSDSDGVNDNADLCDATVIPEGVPTRGALNPNHWALTANGNGFDFDTVIKGKGKGPNRSYTIEDTAGCSCEQIIEMQGLGSGHTKHGCSISAMDDWIESFVNP